MKNMAKAERPKSAMAMLPPRPFRPSGKVAQTAFRPATREGNSSIPTVNHFSADLGILKIRYFQNCCLGRDILALPQRIVLKQKTALYVVDGSWIGPSSLRKGKLFHAPSMQQSRQAKVSFDATRLVIKSVLLIALLGELFFDGPGLGPHGRIFDRHLIFDRGWSGPRPALDQVQVLARAFKIGLRAEVCHVDDEGVALSVAARIAIPLTDIGGQVRAAVHDNVALPPLALADVVEDRDAAGRLHDPPVAAGPASKLGQPAGQAAVRQVAVLRTVMAVDRYDVVA